jgi:2'-5' RNA ligase
MTLPAGDATFVILVPVFEEAGAVFVERCRAAYDRLHDEIEPHVTLVFPQTPHGPRELRGPVEEIFEGVPAPEIVFDRLIVHREPGESYLFAAPSDASIIAELTSFHERLYRLGALASTLTNSCFAPHMTIGRFADAAGAEAARSRCAEDFRPIRARLALVAIGSLANGRCVIVHRKVLAAS